MEVNETTRPLTEVPAENTPETPVSTVENDEKTLYSPKQTQEEVIERLTEINNNTCDADKQEIDYLKQTFYKLHKSEQDTARKNFIEQGGNPEDFTPAPDQLEAKFKEIMSSIKEKRSVMAAEQEQEKEENLQKKLEILEKMKALTENTEDTGKIYNEFKQLQQKWNEIKQIHVGKIKELTVYGDDYDTRDGSCIRDYVHVCDIAHAHTLALQLLMENKNAAACEVYNLGTGNGVSVLEAIHAFEKVSDVKLNYKIGPRRPGDIVAIYANNSLAKEKLKWDPKYSLDEMMATAWKWQLKLQDDEALHNNANFQMN